MKKQREREKKLMDQRICYNIQYIIATSSTGFTFSYRNKNKYIFIHIVLQV